MAEATGLLLGTLALASLFNDCVEGYGYVEKFKLHGKDYEILSTRLDVEKAMLLQWGDRAGLLQTNDQERDSRLDDKLTAPVIEGVLNCIKLILADSEKLKSKYGLVVSTNAATPAEDNPSLVSNSRMNAHTRSYREFLKKINKKQIQTPILRKVKWAIHDCKKFGELLDVLSFFNSRLNDLLPITAKLHKMLVMEDLLSVKGESSTLQLIERVIHQRLGSLLGSVSTVQTHTLTGGNSNALDVETGATEDSQNEDGEDTKIQETKSQEVADEAVSESSHAVDLDRRRPWQWVDRTDENDTVSLRSHHGSPEPVAHQLDINSLQDPATPAEIPESKKTESSAGAQPINKPSRVKKRSSLRARFPEQPAILRIDVAKSCEPVATKLTADEIPLADPVQRGSPEASSTAQNSASDRPYTKELFTCLDITQPLNTAYARKYDAAIARHYLTNIGLVSQRNGQNKYPDLLAATDAFAQVTSQGIQIGIEIAKASMHLCDHFNGAATMHLNDESCLLASSKIHRAAVERQYVGPPVQEAPATDVPVVRFVSEEPRSFEELGAVSPSLKPHVIEPPKLGKSGIEPVQAGPPNPESPRPEPVIPESFAYDSETCDKVAVEPSDTGPSVKSCYEPSSDSDKDWESDGPYASVPDRARRTEANVAEIEAIWALYGFSKRQEDNAKDKSGMRAVSQPNVVQQALKTFGSGLRACRRLKASFTAMNENQTVFSSLFQSLETLTKKLEDEKSKIENGRAGPGNEMRLRTLEREIKALENEITKIQPWIDKVNLEEVQQALQTFAKSSTTRVEGLIRDLSVNLNAEATDKETRRPPVGNLKWKL
jgi:hypothetical protein